MNHAINSLPVLRSNFQYLLTVLFAIGGVLAVVPTSKSADFAVNWFSIGGASSGGAFALAGSVGQSDAGMASGGPYSLVSGFWSGAGVATTPDALPLSITREAGAMVISWPAPSTGFVLQETAALHSENWNNVAIAPTDLGGRKQVTVTPPVGTRFYRLRK